MLIRRKVFVPCAALLIALPTPGDAQPSTASPSGFDRKLAQERERRQRCLTATSASGEAWRAVLQNYLAGAAGAGLELLEMISRSVWTHGRSTPGEPHLAEGLEAA